MKRLLLVFVIIVLTSCSLDNKTGIWKDAANISVDNQSPKTIINNNLNKKYEDILKKKKKLSMKKKSLLIFLIVKLTHL